VVDGVPLHEQGAGSGPDRVARAKAQCAEAEARALARLERHARGPRAVLGRRAVGWAARLGLAADGPEARTYARCDQLLEDARDALQRVHALEAAGADPEAIIQATFVAKSRFDGLERQLTAIERRHRSQRFD